jgi:hypothetical protein
LVLSRQLFELARQNLKIQNDVSLHACANLMQDAVEAFLLTVADHVNAAIDDKTPFDKYFVQINAAIQPKELPFKTKLLRLNRIRVSSKHQCILPPKGECESLAITVLDFFEQVSTEHLGVNFLTATPIDLLNDGEPKKLLVQAQRDRATGELVDCVLNCRKALYIEIEHDYDISQFRTDAPKEIGLAAAFGPFSKAPFFAKSDDYVRKNVRNAADFIVFDHATIERELLRDGVDPTMFWNILRLTPAMWRARDSKQWFVRRDLELLTNEALSENVDYVLTSTLEIVLSIHTKRRSVKWRAPRRFNVTLAHESVPVFQKADCKSEVVGTTSPGVMTLETEFDIEGIWDDKHYWMVYDRDRLLIGYVLESDLVFKEQS